MHPTTNLAVTLLVGAGAFIAGLLGSLTGLGGGVVIIPMLTILFGFDIHYAIGASLVSVIGTSSGSAAAYVREGYTNIRVGMLLEVATSLGAVGGAYLATMVSAKLIGIIFGLVLLHSAWSSLRPHRDVTAPVDKLSKFFRLDGSFPTAAGLQEYHVRDVPLGFTLMGVAGVLSGLLGIGSGALKVIAMDRVMKLPFKVSTTTSNFMIGVTAAASAGVYLSRGYIDPSLAMPVMLVVLGGSLTGARVLVIAPVKQLRTLFAAIIAVLAIEMIYNSLKGRF
jgi:uncharacterized membrane protein YfcA